MREAALRLLGVRQRSVAELRRRLIQKGYPDLEIEACLKRLEAQRLLDDGAFAKLWVEGRAGRRLIGRGRLRQELAAKGVARGTAEEALGGVSDETEAERAAAHARRKWGALSRLPGDVARRRLYGMLARRGFETEAIRKAIKRVTQGDINDD